MSIFWLTFCLLLCCGFQFLLILLLPVTKCPEIAGWTVCVVRQFLFLLHSFGLSELVMVVSAFFVQQWSSFSLGV